MRPAGGHKGRTLFRPNLDDQLAKMDAKLHNERVKRPMYEPYPGTEDLDPATMAAIASDARQFHRRRSTPPPVVEPSEDDTNKEKDDTADLLGVMAGRLKALETQVASAKEQLAEKQREIRKYVKEIDGYKKLGATNDALKEENKVLTLQNTKLMQKVMDMQNFMKDYGLDWVGYNGAEGNDDSPTSSSSQDQPTHTKPRYRAPTEGEGLQPTTGSKPSLWAALGDANQEAGFNWGNTHDPPKKSGYNVEKIDTADGKIPFDMKKIIKNVQELNVIADTQMEFQKKAGGGGNMFKLNAKQVLHMTFYCDGVVVNDGPFRPYAWPAGQAIVMDLLDGYFPYEFKERHPEGMPLNVIDKSTEKCPAPKKGNDSRVRDIHQVNDHGYKVVSKEQFLKNVPSNVIVNGKIMPVKSEIDAMLGGNPPAGSATNIVQARRSPDIIQTEAGNSLENQKNGGGGVDDKSICTIQLKYPTSPTNASDTQMAVVHLWKEQTVGELRGCVRSFLQGKGFASVAQNFELCTLYPLVIHTDDTKTLKQADLCPKASVLVRTPK
eukprot:TRINITY_DN74686_c0_g1_i1.p1 TRINITY_DN74686_c0_g1~~TRINITY_DN74686_c0_g1_i1.p1  ORF type:complete len:550 (-),score=60.82 TRINITY_DN74686_c0_g1_i1:539-2188(-)